jgi:group I intron endonuclease
MTYKIYRILNSANGKSYIGFTQKTIEERFAQHFYSAMSRKSNYRIHQAIRKYGPDAFTIHELAAGNNEEHVLNVLEPQYIAEYNTIKNGYNTFPGGRNKGTYKHSEESKQKMSDNNFWKGKDRSGTNNPMFGQKHSESVKAAISQKNKGNTFRLGTLQTEEAKVKIGTKAKERYVNGYVNHRKGVVLTEETKRKISEAKQGKISYIKTYEVIFPDGHTEEISNMAEFCRIHNLHKGNMSSVAKGTLKQYKGFKCSVLNRNSLHAEF